MSNSNLLLAVLVTSVAALPLLLKFPHDVILHNSLSSLAPNLAAFPASALPTLSGYLTADASTKARLFFTFYEATSPERPISETPLILWLQGGPGCSSEIGNFYELGPWRISESLSLQYNADTWAAPYAVLFIDNPVGTGFSVAERPEDIPVDQEGVAQHLYSGLTQFFNQHPQHRTRPFFLAGESYAGKYVPYLGEFVVHRMDQAGQPLMAPLLPSPDSPSSPRHPFRLDGVIIGNALVHPRTQVQTHADAFYWAGLIDQGQREQAKAWAARVVGHVDRAEWWQAYRQRTDYVNWLQNISGIATPLDYRRSRPYHVNGNWTEWLALVLNRPKVKAALKAEAGKEWVSCSGVVRQRMANDTMKSTMAQVEFLLTRLPTLTYQGMFDLKDGAPCSEAWMRETRWPGIGAFFEQERQPWHVNKETAGHWRVWGPLTHVVLLGAGHEVPADQSLRSQAMILRWVEAHLNVSKDLFNIGAATHHSPPPQASSTAAAEHGTPVASHMPASALPPLEGTSHSPGSFQEANPHQPDLPATPSLESTPLAVPSESGTASLGEGAEEGAVGSGGAEGQGEEIEIEFPQET